MNSTNGLEISCTQSSESTLLQVLTEEQRLRLSAILDGYLRGLEIGPPASEERLLREHPDLAQPLVVYLECLEQMHEATPAYGLATTEIAEREATPHALDRRIGDFVIVREIGRGGMGVVYEAWQLSLGRQVALKVLPFASVLNARQIARFKNEAHAAAQLHHPNIVPVYAVGAERGVHYYAMQFIDGQPLDQVIHELREASDSTDRMEHFRRTVEIGIQAADALQAAHSCGIVHRDIKPSNLLLDAGGKL